MYNSNPPPIKLLSNNLELLEILLLLDVVKTRGEGKRLLEQGGITINLQTIKNPKEKINLPPQGVLFRKSRRIEYWLQPLYNDEVWDDLEAIDRLISGC